MVSVPGSFHGSPPTVTASDRNFAVSAYGGEVAGDDADGCCVVSGLN
jgi:hypothetical protein